MHLLLESAFQRNNKINMHEKRNQQNLKAPWIAIGVWSIACVLLFALDGIFNLANLSLLLVLASAVAGMFLSTGISLIASTFFVLLFNWFFIEPRYTFNVHLHQDLLLLVTMLGVSIVVGYLMSKLRISAERESQHAKMAEDLYELSQSLREACNNNFGAKLLQEFIAEKSGHHVSVLLADSSFLIGNASALDQQGLWACVQQFAALGPGSGRHENQITIFLPIRGHSRASGAIAIHRESPHPLDTTQQQFLQQACDLLGLEIERARSVEIAQQAEQDVQTQSLRNTLLTSISHDYRTPLANLIGAASSIQDQGDRLSREKIQALAKTIIEEADHLHRMTTNTLHLARLDAAPLQIRKDWESLHELIGSVLAKTRQRYPFRQIDVHIPDALPLVHCDAILLVQLFDNLLENAIKYSPDSSVIEIDVQAPDSSIELRVIDNGRGITDAWKTKVFQAFERVHEHDSQADASEAHQLRRGVGVGLAVCQAIAKVHDAKIWVQDHMPQGTEMCVSFPIKTQPNLHNEDI